MAKFYGTIGFSDTVESKPGVWEEVITERNYYGDVVRSVRRYQSGDKVNDNLDISNEISIVADPFANENFHSMKYVAFMGTKWKITSVEVEFPRRLKLTIGGVYNDTNGSQI